MTELEGYRKEIDTIDRNLVQLFERRMAVARQVAEYKLAHGMPVLDAQREKEVIASRCALLEDAGMSAELTRFFEQIMSISRARQRKLIRAQTVAQPREAEGVAFQGETGAYSELACVTYWNPNVARQAYDSFADVFDAVESGAAQYGMIPIENSYAGAVESIYDLLESYQLHIVGEQYLPIEHLLLGVEGATADSVEEVFSHDQAFLQCANFLKQHENWKRTPYYNTAVAAHHVARLADPCKAAIANRYASQLFGLRVLAEGIADQTENMTRFVVIAREPQQTGNKASISFVLEHRSGTLAEVLQLFALNELNMVKIESRPLKSRPFEYRFTVDFEGDGLTEHLPEVLEHLRKRCTQLRLLGVYAKGAEQGA